MYQPNNSMSDIRGDARQYQSTPNNDFRPYQPPSPISELKTNQYNDEQRYFKTSEARTDRFQDNYSLKLDNQALENQIWTGLVAHTHTFESARIESIQCLESLSAKLSGEISNINFKLDAFNSKMGKALSN